VPYPNEHSCRLRDPGDFQPDSFRRISSGRRQIIVGRLKGQSTTTAQAYRYPTSEYSEAEARKDCEAAKGSFEAARKTQEMRPEETLDPLTNPFIRDETAEETEEKGAPDETDPHE
jgi:hypothetical protein